MNIGERIKNIRKAKGVSQQEVADKIGTGRVQYNRIETGKSEPTVPMLERIAQALDTPVTDFFTDSAAAEVNSIDRPMAEKLRLIEELDEPQRSSIFTFIDTALSAKRLRDSLQQIMTS